MAILYPIQYELNPKDQERGIHWVTLSLKNTGGEDLTHLDVRLNSLDAYSITIYGTGSYVSSLGPGQESVLPFQVQANATGRVYVSLDGFQDGEPFHWESPDMRLKVGQELAELVSLFALTQPYPPAGEQIKCEATLLGLVPSRGLRLEFWAETPSAEFEELGTVETKDLSGGEVARYAAEVTPEEKGLYTIHAYLYHGTRRIGHEIERVYVQKT
jgi:hypothetical protein